MNVPQTESALSVRLTHQKSLDENFSLSNFSNWMNQPSGQDRSKRSQGKKKVRIDNLNLALTGTSAYVSKAVPTMAETTGSPKPPNTRADHGPTT